MSSFATIVLAAGRSSRMGDQHKLLAVVAGQPMIRHVVGSALASSARPVIVVTGHRQDDIAFVLDGLPVTLAHNPHYAAGMAGSLVTGIAALPLDVAGAVVLLGDMPKITREIIDALIAAAAPAGPMGLTVPTYQGIRGNPVVIGRTWFETLTHLQGDKGARRLIEANPESVTEVDCATDAILFDVDTPDSLAHLMQTPAGL
jgi:molybdenum cofactor cytidylyltransferase